MAYLPNDSTLLQLLRISKIRTVVINDILTFQITITIPHPMQFNFDKMHLCYNFQNSLINGMITTYIKLDNIFIRISQSNETYILSHNCPLQDC